MMTHDELCTRAEKWLKAKGCGVVFREGFRAIVHSGEQPDASGGEMVFLFLSNAKKVDLIFMPISLSVFVPIP